MTDTSRTVVAALVAALVVSTMVAPAAMATTTASVAESSGSNESAETAHGEAYTGSHVSFEASHDAVTGYTVGDSEVLASVQTEARDDYRSRAGLSVGASLELSTVTEVEAAAVSLSAKSETNATVRSESGAAMEAHDNERGILQVRADDGAQVVKAEVAAGGEAAAEGEDRVVVTSENGAESTFVVVGEGSVAVNEEGDVVADLDEDARLVLRSYANEERDDDDREHERMIAEGKAVAEVYVEERDGEQVADAVTYAGDTSVEARQSAENEVEVTVERTASEGKVVITQVQESAVGAAEDIEVQVDGEAAAEASSYSELEAAAADGDESKYMVRQAGSAEGSAEVLVALNHFSERTVTMSGDGDGASSGDGSNDDGSSGDGSAGDGGDDPTSTGAPGFGVGVAVVALLGAVLLARRR